MDFKHVTTTVLADANSKRDPLPIQTMHQGFFRFSGLCNFNHILGQSSHTCWILPLFNSFIFQKLQNLGVLTHDQFSLQDFQHILNTVCIRESLVKGSSKIRPCKQQSHRVSML